MNHFKSGYHRVQSRITREVNANRKSRAFSEIYQNKIFDGEWSYMFPEQYMNKDSVNIKSLGFNSFSSVIIKKLEKGSKLNNQN